MNVLNLARRWPIAISAFGKYNKHTIIKVGFSTQATNPSTVAEKYESLVSEGKLKRDPRQLALVSKLDRLRVLLSKYESDRIRRREEEAELANKRAALAAQRKAAEDEERQPEAAVNTSGHNVDNQLQQSPLSITATTTKYGTRTSAKTELEEKVSNVKQDDKQTKIEEVVAPLPPLKVPRGLYVHGNVGTGKTMLMDMFFDSLNGVPRRRVHLHNFVQDIHARIHKERTRTRTKNKTPTNNNSKGAYQIIQEIGEQLAKENAVLAFDEFFVTDIADAAILESLLDALLRHGIVLIATSNADPRDLHRSFDSFIPRLLAHCRVHDIESDVDYREGGAANEAGGDETKREFHIVTDHPLKMMEDILEKQSNKYEVNVKLPCGFGRSIEVPFAWRDVPQNRQVACGTFDWLCGSKVSAFGPNEYHAICERFDRFILVDVPIVRIQAGRVGDESRRLGTFLDIAYDSGMEVVTISKYQDFFVAEEDDVAAGNESEQSPETIASIRSFLRARSRWRHLSRGRT